MRKILCLLGILVIVAGCQKGAVQPDAPLASTISLKNVSPDALKTLLGGLTGLDPKLIDYNETTKQFSFSGKNLATFDEMVNVYAKSGGLEILNRKNSSGTKVNLVPADPIEPVDDGPGGGGGGGYPPPGNGGGGTPPDNGNDGAALLNFGNPWMSNVSAGNVSTYANASSSFVDVTKGYVISYTLKPSQYLNTTNKINIPYNTTIELEATVKISVPHANGKIAPFTVYLVMKHFAPVDYDNSKGFWPGSSISDKDVKDQNAYTVEKTFKFSIGPKDNASDRLACLFWTNESETNTQLFINNPMYEVFVASPLAGGAISEQVGPKVDLYRLYYKNGEHFYTVSRSERISLIRWNEKWKDEGSVCRVWNRAEPNTIPLYRFFNKDFGEHMYTTNAAEAKNLVTNLGFVSEGIIGWVYPTIDPPGINPGSMTAVHRYLGVTTLGHLFTNDFNEIGNGQGAGFQHEGVGFYALIPSYEVN